ncbi:YtzH-like family protein [Salipaludibacillus daqingensis]|uniref:YtzH-like family protein n=1 Tax=Salipaludibacillus daqingensis TaxID=3041001 RepID=UPI002475FDEB|nr:YtzH-like family protein [Salipaludibacillus daqingensis]
MATHQMLEQFQSILKQQKQKGTATREEFNQLRGIIKVLRDEKLNENFDGTIQEIHAFIDKADETENLTDLIEHHKLNISRWIEEISLLIDGGGKVTIDYEQRKGREV